MKCVEQVIGDTQITDQAYRRLWALLTGPDHNLIKNTHTTVAHFLVNDLNNFVGRLKRLKGVPGTTRYTQLLRYGKKKSIAVISAQNQRKTGHFKNTVGYWTRSGLTVSEAEAKVSEIQTSRSRKSPSASPGSRFSVRSRNYWMDLGYSEQEAKERVADVQRRKHTPERNSKWQETLNRKSEAEKLEINRKKSLTVSGLVARGFSVDEAERGSREYWSNRKVSSKISDELFLELSSAVPGKSYFHVKNHEKQLNGFYVDFFHEDTGLVIEFYGDYWHRRPGRYPADMISHGLRSDHIWERDRARIEAIRSSTEVKDVIIVWESDYRNDKTQVIEHLKKEINGRYTHDQDNRSF